MSLLKLKGHPRYDISTTTLLFVSCSLLLSQPLPLTEEVVLCENDHDTFTCDVDMNETMRIIYANYGRLSLDICVPPGGINYPYNITDCRAANSTEILQAKCDGRVSCEFHADASKFVGHPCPYVHKYLEVTYACIQPGLSSVNTNAESTVTSTGSPTIPTATNAVSNLPTTESQWSTGTSLNMAAEDTPYNFYSREIRIAVYSVVGGVLVVGLTTVTGCLLCQRNISRFCCESGTTTVRPADHEEEM